MSKLGIAWAWVKGVFSFKSSGVESVIDYVLTCLYELVDKMDIGGRILVIHEYADKAARTMEKYSEWCPIKWLDEYSALMENVRFIATITEDSKIDRGEVTLAVTKFKELYGKWMED